MAEDLVNGEIDEVPVVRLLGILQIHRHNLVALSDGLNIVFQSFGGQSFKLCHKNQKTAKPHFVPTVH